MTALPEEDLWYEGFTAGLKANNRNPYPEGTLQNKIWAIGYVDGAEQEAYMRKEINEDT